MISSIISTSLIPPNAATGVFTCFLISAAYWTLHPCSINMEGCVITNTSLFSWIPADTWMISTFPSIILAISTASSISYPPGIHSEPLIRNSIGKSGPTASRTFSTTSSEKRIRFSRLPPQRSVLLLKYGEANWPNSHPCPPWIKTISKPASFTSLAALPNAVAVSSICSSVMAFTGTPWAFNSPFGPIRVLLAAEWLLAAPNFPPWANSMVAMQLCL